MPRSFEVGQLVILFTVQVALGLAVGGLLLSLYRAARDLYLVYWADTWLATSALSLAIVASMLLGSEGGRGFVFGLSGVVIAYIRPPMLGLAALSLARRSPNRAHEWALFALSLACGLVAAALAHLEPGAAPARFSMARAPSQALFALANLAFAWSFARNSPHSRTKAGRIVIVFSLLYAVHLFAVSFGWVSVRWAGFDPYPNATVSALIGLLMPMGITAGIMLSVLQDMVESQYKREILIAELERKNSELERFTYTVSHDLRSPLVTILSFIGFVEKSLAGGEGARAQKDLGRIRAAAMKMEQLLRELLDLSRIGRVTGPSQDVDLKQLAREALSSLESAVSRRRAEVRIDDKLPVVWADRVRVREVLQNLLENAIKFTPPERPPIVDVGARGRDAGGRWIVFVRDNGIGVEPRHHERIFGLFEKLDPESEGTGVGLAIVRRIIEVHDGRLWVESEGKGNGATFCFTLPSPAPAQPE